MIDVKVHGMTGTIVLRRPEQANALNLRTIELLTEALDDLRQQKSVRGIVITGSGRHFCSGLDALELQTISESSQSLAQWFAVSQQVVGLMQQILLNPKPIIAACDGHVCGTGLAVALACDLLLATNQTTFAAHSTRWGVVSGIVAPLLTFRCGGAIASRMLIGRESMSAETLSRIGVVHRIVSNDLLWAEADRSVQNLAEAPIEAIQLTKRLINEMVGEQLQTHLSSGASALATSLTTEAAQEGLLAFKEKRTPQFPS